MKKMMYLFALIILTISCLVQAGNPLLQEWDTPFQTPPFNEIKNEHFMPAFLETMKAEKSEVEAIVNNKEEPTFKKGILQPITPRKGILEGGWGGLGLAFRYDHFEADESVYEYLIEQGVSVREAKAYSFALNWYLNRYARLIVDFTRTDFVSPLLIYRDPLTGDAIYSDYENVLTGRFQFQF